MCKREMPHANPLSYEVDFMDQLEGETNRRIAPLALLYLQRRTNPRFPEVPLVEVKRRMGFPPYYLDFTTWYASPKQRCDHVDRRSHVPDRRVNTTDRHVYVRIAGVSCVYYSRGPELLTDSDTERLHLSVKVAALKTEKFRGATDVVARLLDFFQDVLAFVCVARLLQR